jgi:predicted membrane chloride channel (bestrophin family)
MFLLPAALVGTGVTLIPATLTSIFATYVLVGIDEIGLEIEYPFPLLPMYSLSKGIQNEVENQMKMIKCMPPIPT